MRSEEGGGDSGRKGTVGRGKKKGKKDAQKVLRQFDAIRAGFPPGERFDTSRKAAPLTLSNNRVFTHVLLEPMHLENPVTSLNKELGPLFLSDDSIWSCPSVSSLSDYSIWRS